ncbi:MAG: PocR ligand-binding domain-containing protein [Treponema sp.]|jgi:AraC-like DNA-binding protein|nr:PocR ligand-binding domain-containing protein [Treponema sp.]
MDMIWSQPRMMNLLKSFYAITSARTGFFDLDGKEILAYPVPRSDYCTLIRSTKKGDNACVKCDRTAYQYAAKHGGINIYQCHAGLTEGMVPIVSSGDERIGYLMIGQFKQSGSSGKKQWDEAYRKAAALQINPRGLKAAYSRLPVMSTEQAQASIHILYALAAYVWQDNCIRVQNEPLSKQVEKYIAAHLDQPLTLSALAQKFGVCKTTLCKAFKRDCDLTVNEAIRRSRIERAKQLLQTGKQPISEIAENVGINDYNYFTKVFKAETSVAPSVFRRLCEGEYLTSPRAASRPTP